MTLPTFVAAGTGSETSCAWPTHQSGDLGLLFVEAGGGTVSTPAGWSVAPGFPVPQVGATTVLSAFFRIATSGAEGNAALAGGTDHMWGTILTFRGVHQTTPIGEVATGSSPSATAGWFPGLRTIDADVMIVNVLAWAIDSAGPISSAEANTSLANVAERFDAGTVTLNGGGIVVVTGEKAVAGTVNTTTVTLTSTSYAAGTLAILQPGSVGGGAAPVGSSGIGLGALNIGPVIA